MKKCRIIVFIIVLLFSIYKIVDNKNLDIEDNIYIVSEKENNEKEDISNKKYNNADSKDYENEKIEAINKKHITVFVSGEVNKPGVVTIENDKRLSDAVNEVGGTTENADLNKINLAIKLKDESHYIIPKVGEDLQSHDNLELENSETSNSNNNNLININTATIQELDNLPGVGEATANKIINYREEKGRFNSIEEIKNVNGIGEKKYEEIKGLINIE